MTAWSFSLEDLRTEMRTNAANKAQELDRHKVATDVMQIDVSYDTLSLLKGVLIAVKNFQVDNNGVHLFVFEYFALRHPGLLL
jgi:hypothetical protein